MTLQNILLRLSRNKRIVVSCLFVDEIMHIKIEETYSYRDLLKMEINIKEKISADVVSKLSSYMMK